MFVRRITFLQSVLASLMVLSAPNIALASGGAAAAKKMAETAADYSAKAGSPKLIERVNNKDPEFYQGELYVVVLSLDGSHLAHPTNPKLIGKSMLDVPDPDGKMFRKERVELAALKGAGWVDYKYKNPVSGKIEPKTAYVLKKGEVIISVGTYKE